MRKILRLVAPVWVAAVIAAPAFAEKPAATVAAYPENPGAHMNLACRKTPALTFNIRLPKAYAEKPTARFPALFISSNSGWLGLDGWAEANEVILVDINDVKNGPWEPIYASQDNVLESVAGYRIHPSLRFATGLSGGAWAAVHMAKRHPKDFAGIVLNCHSANMEQPPVNCRCLGFIGGLKDTVHPDKLVREAAEKLEKAGRYVQQAHLNQGHNWGPPPVIAGMLDNMIFYTRMTGAGLNAEERVAVAKLPDEVLAKAAAEPDAAKACAMLGPLVDIEEFRSRPFRAKALALWCEVRAKGVAALSGKAALDAYADEATYRRFNEAPGSATPAVKELLQKFSADASLKNELPALAEFARMRENYRREMSRANAKTLKEWQDRLGKFAKKNEGTVAARLAAALAPT